MRKAVLGILLLLPAVVMAQNWDYIRESGDYYYGVGYGTNEQEASERAMADLIGMIATNVSTDFQYLMDETNNNGKLEHQSRVHNCIKTYSTSSLTNVEKWVIGKEINWKGVELYLAIKGEVTAISLLKAKVNIPIGSWTFFK